ncbi:MAG: hypothetical protein O3B01_03330 [Planctomycetota bacterium]|nr:hypothetical protein [Planctomycetota bacterium]MDA1137592.1 hypothetical protein [Planctomycetota bacterium]
MLIPTEGPYEDRFRELLKRVKPAKLELGVRILMRKMRESEVAKQISTDEAFKATYAHALQRVVAMLARAGECRLKTSPEEGD